MSLEAIALVLLSALLHPIRDLLLKGHPRPESAYLGVTAGWIVLAALHAGVTGSTLGLADTVWPVAAISAGCLSAYYFGTMAALKTGDLSVYYPIIRSSPLLIAALSWAFAGRTYATTVMVGIFMIVVAGFALQREPGRLIANPKAITLALVAMAGSAGYTMADSAAMQISEPAAFLFWVYLGVAPAFALLALWFRPREVPVGVHLLAGWRISPLRIALASFVSYVSYVCILTAFGIGAGAAETAAIRQASIPVSVVLAALVLGETRFLGRLAWSGMIAAGIILIALTG